MTRRRILIQLQVNLAALAACFARRYTHGYVSLQQHASITRQINFRSVKEYGAWS